MVSNIDLFRNDTDADTGDNKSSAQSDQRMIAPSQPSGTYAQSPEYGQEQIFRGQNPDQNTYQDPYQSATAVTPVHPASADESAMSGILGRIIDHIENADRKNNAALDAINNRLNQLTMQVSPDPAPASFNAPNTSAEQNELQNTVSGLSRHIDTAKQSWSGISPREAFEERLTELTSQIPNDASASANAVETPIASQQIPEDLPSITATTEPTFATTAPLSPQTETPFAEQFNAEDNKFQSPDIVYTITDNHEDIAAASPSNQPSSHLSGQEKPTQRDDIAQSFDDVIAVAGLPHEETTTAVSSTYDTEEAAMEALAMGFQEQSDEQAPLTRTTQKPQAEKEPQLPLPPANLLTAPTATNTPLDIPQTAKPQEDIGPRLDQLVAKFEDVLNARNTEPLLKTIESQLAELPTYLHGEEKRQQRIDQIETNIASLTAMIQSTNAAIAELSEKIAEETANHVVNKLDWTSSADKLAAIDEYLRNLNDSDAEKEEQTSKALEGVYDALEQMIGRLEAIEPAAHVAALTSSSAAQFESADEAEQTVSEYTPNYKERGDNYRLESARSNGSSAEDDLSYDDEDFTEPETPNIGLIRNATPARTANLDDFDEEDFASREERGLYSVDISTDENEVARKREAFLNAARSAAASSHDTDDTWDRQIPPYMAASRNSRPGGIFKYGTGVAAAIIVVLSAGAGLLLSQMSYFRGETDSTASIAQRSPASPSIGTASNNSQTGQFGNDRYSSSTPTSGQEVATANRYERQQFPENTGAIGSHSQNTNNTQISAAPPQFRQSAPAQQQTTSTSPLAPPPGTAIGHVSDKGIRNQLHQAVRQQQIAERAGQNAPNANFPQATTYSQSGLGGQAANADQVTAMAAPNQSQSPSQKSLPPAEIGPMSLRVAAAEGNALAEYQVGSRYARGMGVNQDLAEAARWFKRAAERGYAPAQYRLATHFERGAGVSKNLDNAKSWYSRSAETGNIKAMHNLAVLHTGREGVKPDYATAAKWFKLAADHGLADSQYNLAVLLENGLGVEKNLTEAYKWLTLASLNGDKEAGKRRDTLRNRMEPSAVAAAERAALEWKQQPAAKGANIDETPQDNFATSTQAPANIPQQITNRAPALVPAPDRAPTGSISQSTTQTKPSSSADPLVKKAQVLLSKLGYDTGPADGQVGPKTREAIIAFERRAGMPVTGDVSLELLKRLASLSI